MKKLSEKLGHILIPLATPFTDDKKQDIKYDAAASLADNVIQRNFCDSLLVAGTSGEFNTLTMEERFELFRVIKDAVENRVPIVAGVCAGSTREAVRIAQEAERLEYDALMVVSPYYCRPTQEGIYQHFALVAQSTELPIMLYNIPIFTGVNVDTETVARLAENYSNIIAIKDELGINPTQMTEYVRVTPDNFSVYNGDDIMVLCGFVQGADGVVSGGSHIIGAQMRDMINFFLAGDMQKAREIHMALDPLFKAFGSNGRVNPIPIWKAALNLCGLNVGPPRLPLAPATSEEIGIIREHLMRLGVLEK